MVSENQAKKQENFQFPIFKKNDNFRLTYSNMLRISNSAVDFRIDFANIAPPLPELENPEALIETTIVLSPEEAKILLTLLNQQLKKYESQFGEILDLYNITANRTAKGGK